MQGQGHLCGLALAAALGATAAAPPSPPPPLPVLHWPVACEAGRSCVIQHYIDHDPGPGARDPFCGPKTNDGHDGADIRLPDLAAMRAGVAVKAAADGRVRGGRDGEPDVSVREAGPDSVKGRECGNGVWIDHAEGWSTQYCHMKRGSIRVKPGQDVKAGDTLGEVGLSGLTEFPHLHITVRKGEEKVDPFAYGEPAGACAGGVSLWAADAGPALAYRAPEVLNTGFAAGALTMEAIEAGAIARPTREAPALVAYARAIGLKAGDRVGLTLTGPDGRVLTAPAPASLDHDKAQWMTFAGVPRPSAGWVRGTYRARLAVTRAGREVAARAFDIAL